MSRPIKVTDGMLSELKKDFETYLTKANLIDGGVQFNKTYHYPKADGDRAKLVYTPLAALKMAALLNDYDIEIGWHGLVERVGEHEFRVTDILVFPQTVSGVTVNTDQEAYVKWLESLTDEQINAMHYQGHSHVRMAASPSSTDMESRRGIVTGLRGEEFYIFAIYNKKMQYTINIYDLKTNTLYEDADIDVSVEDPAFDLSAFLKNAKTFAKAGSVASGNTGAQKAATYQGYKSYGAGARAVNNVYSGYDYDDEPGVYGHGFYGRGY